MSGNRAPSFVYPPLQPGHIRLIRVQQQSNRPYITCDMKIVKLEESPQFTALSYTWGGQIPNRMLFIGDAWLKVTPNLYAFLLQVQNFGEKAKEEGVEWIWADSLCINQQDDADKSIQVGMMRKIYERAQRVVVWLGEATYALERFLKQLDAMAENRIRGEHHQSIALRKPQEQKPADFQIPQEFLTHPYWRRVWILQEITSNPKHGVSLWYGHARCCFSSVLSLMRAASAEKSVSSRAEYDQNPFEVLQLLREARQQSTITILDMIQMKGRWESSDPKDKLLALVQLSADGLDYIPDYSLNMHQLYADFAKHLIGMHGHLDVLEHVHPQKHGYEKEGPSWWAPDWTLDGSDVSQFRPMKSWGLVPFRTGPLKGRLRLPPNWGTQRAEYGNHILHVDAIILGIYHDSAFFWFPRYFRALPDEASLWTAALSPSTLFKGSIAEFNRASATAITTNNLPQQDDILCVLPGARFPVILRPLRASHGLQEIMTFKYVGASDIPPIWSDDDLCDLFTEQLLDIMVDDLLLQREEASSELRAQFRMISEYGDRIADGRDYVHLWYRGPAPSQGPFELASLGRQKAWLHREEIHPDTDLAKYAVRIQLA